jgi:hypothetical protein
MSANKCARRPGSSRIKARLADSAHESIGGAAVVKM